MTKILFKTFIILLLSIFCIKAEEIKKIEVIGNDRISKDTIIMFADINDQDYGIMHKVENTEYRVAVTSNSTGTGSSIEML